MDGLSGSAVMWGFEAKLGGDPATFTADDEHPLDTFAPQHGILEPDCAMIDDS